MLKMRDPFNAPVYFNNSIIRNHKINFSQDVPGKLARCSCSGSIVLVLA